MQTVQYVEIQEDAGQRLDNYLLKTLKGVPRSLVYKIIRQGEVRVNKKRAKPLQRLKEGDNLRIPPIKYSPTEKPELKDPGTIQWLEDSILHENADFLILNKPAGLAVHGGSGISLGAIEMLQQLRPLCKTLELGHRLDKETSGCLFVAKKRSALRHFHELLRTRDLQKTYMAIVSNRWTGKQKRSVNQPLHKYLLPSGERMVRIDEEGKSSTTHFEFIENFEHAALIKARPITGRTHQIRVHALFLDHPILGDSKYFKDTVEIGASRSRAFTKERHDSDEESAEGRTPASVGKARFRDAPRLCLHASRLEFQWPELGQCCFEAPFDEKMDTFLKSLRDE